MTTAQACEAMGFGPADEWEELFSVGRWVAGGLLALWLLSKVWG